mgnify:CR=1 FL=1
MVPSPAERLSRAALERAPELPELKKTDAGYVWAGRDYPAARVSLRSTGPEAFTIVEGSTGAILGIVTGLVAAGVLSKIIAGATTPAADVREGA